MAKRILLIDDDELLCDVLADFLVLEGYEVEQASNGLQGLDRLAASPPFDVVVLDLLMPEMDGVRFLHALEAGSQPIPPVLVLSASATAEVVNSLSFPMVAGVMRKPVQPAQLLERLSLVLGQG